MLASNDLKEIASMIDPNQESTPIMGQTVDVDVNNLDYGYISKCQSTREIKQLLDYLKSGKEGSYPELELFMQQRLAELDPNRYPMPLSQRELYQAKEEVANDLKEWVSSITPQPVENASSSKVASRSQALPIFVSTNKKQNASKPKTAAPPRIKSFDFRGWDKFDVDQELEKLDQEKSEELTTSAPTIINKPSNNLPQIPENISQSQKIAFSENEKIKGNDCMRSKEYESALEYYTNSLHLYRTTAVLNNRALTYLKLENYSKSIEDCTASLEMETSFKALLRRSTAYYHIGKYQDAVMDVDSALELSPNNAEAVSLRQKIMDKWSDVDGTITQQQQPVAQTFSSAAVERAFSKKMKIVEIEEEEEEEKKVVAPVQAEVKPAKKVVIVDVDEDSSDEES